MGDKTKIAWTDSTWNPLIGCSRVSPGCEHCYAERLSGTRNGRTRLMPERLDKPLRWRRPRKIFVCDMGDLFHETVSFEFIAEVFGVMAACPQHVFQVLTKRSARMLEFFERVELPHWPMPNVWLGVTTEDQMRADERIPMLLATKTAVRFVSAEPLLGPIDFFAVQDPPGVCRIGSLDWVIVGGESGPKARPFAYEWALDIVQQCKSAGIACFVKQMGSDPYVENVNLWDLQDGQEGSLIDRGPAASCRVKLHHHAGADPAEWPKDLQVRKYPDVERRIRVTHAVEVV